MNIAPYRRVLGLPGLPLLLFVGMLARIPATAAALTVTMHVVNTLGLNFTQAGIAGAAAMVGGGIGAPLAGRLVDKVGLRPVLIVTTTAQAIYWATAADLTYLVLVGAAFLSGVLSMPIFSVMRQFMAAMVPLQHHRTAFALDSMAVELSYMVGPALAVATAISLGSRPSMHIVGIGLVAAGVALSIMNPPTRSEAEEQDQNHLQVPRRAWLSPSMITLLAVSSVATFVLTSTELSIVATLKDANATSWTGLVIGLWCAYSLIGGFVYGALHRSLSALTLIGGLCALTIPLSLVGGSWWWLCLAIIPAGLLCAPSMAATVDTMSQWVPARARGEAMGLHGTALTCGVAAGGPFAGAVIDGLGPQWAFAAAGSAGLLLTLLAIPFWRRAPAPTDFPSAPPTPTAQAGSLAGVPDPTLEPA